MVAGANVHDTKLLEATLEAIVVERPQPTDEAPQHLCLDKGYDNPTGHQNGGGKVGRVAGRLLTIGDLILYRPPSFIG